MGYRTLPKTWLQSPICDRYSIDFTVDVAIVKLASVEPRAYIREATRRAIRSPGTVTADPGPQVASTGESFTAGAPVLIGWPRTCDVITTRRRRLGSSGDS
jgi:hypothetical protein